MNLAFFRWVTTGRFGPGVLCWIMLALLLGCGQSNRLAEIVLASYRDDLAAAPIEVLHPFSEAVFPADIAPTVFWWEDSQPGVNAWLIIFPASDSMPQRGYVTREKKWRPPVEVWSEFKRQSKEKLSPVVIVGFDDRDPRKILSKACLNLSTAREEVGAPIFYREVPLPFINAVRDPSQIQWRFGSVSSAERPRIVLEKMPVCGNCHSFSRDGAWLGMDVDYANNKGSYVFTRVGRQMELAPRDILTWDDYRKEDGEPTFGLLSQVSPDGRHAISTVKDKSVFVATPGLEFSQLFFPIKGILVCYQRDSRTFQALPGADDPRYVQSNPTWSPNGQDILFARAEAYSLRNQTTRNQIILSLEDCEEFVKEGKPFKFDLYRLPFNEGRGGKPEPLRGASGDGRSNYFPKYSPDGKWIVFCKSSNYMLLQPDSELYIIPAAGGEARRLRANTRRMNSWHSWSPNGHWLVFSSKHFGPYTQLFLTHIDQEGNSTPPVWLEQFTASDRAANIPEFVGIDAQGIQRITERFLDDVSFLRVAYGLDKSGDADGAIREYLKALNLNPRSSDAHQRLGYLIANVKKNLPEGLQHTQEALRLNPDNARAHYDLGMTLMHQEDYEKSVEHFQSALRLLPDGGEKPYLPSSLRFHLGLALLYEGRFAESEPYLSEAASLEKDNPEIHYFLALSQAHQGKISEPAGHYAQAVKLAPSINRLPELPDLLGINCSQAGQFSDALNWAAQALKLAQNAGSQDMIDAISARIKLYEQNQPFHLSE
jgi:tetratricopeptide (TPR) repeat protein